VRLDEAVVAYRPLTERPGKILCIGRNYAAHAREGGAEPLSYPDVFFRAATSLVAHRDALIRPQVSDKFDYEGELVFVVGRRARHVRREDAFDYVAGYSIFNEGSVRDYQRKATQWTMGKNFDGTGAFGPDLVTPGRVARGCRWAQAHHRSERADDAGRQYSRFHLPRRGGRGHPERMHDAGARRRRDHRDAVGGGVRPQSARVHETRR
jgi:2-keto-4-pentenoate hydratase/2-oxohepta-3-ene-1,7-dioic acid hydratase in catechol pathway